MRREALAVMVTLVACGGTVAPGGDAGDASSEATPTTQVVGHVIDVDGRGLAGADVLIDNQDVKTDAQGAFTVAAPAMYDALVVFAELPNTTPLWITKFVGLATRNPQLQVEARRFGTGQLVGTVSGPGAPPSSPTGSFVLVFTPTLGLVNDTHFAATQAVGGPYPTWPVFLPGDATSAGGTLRALYMSTSVINGYGSVPATVMVNSTVQADIVMAVPTPTQLQGTIAWPDGATTGAVQAIMVADGQPAPLPEAAMGGAFTVASFDEAGVSWGVRAFNGGASQWKFGLTASTSNIALAPPPAPQWLSPTNGATFDETTSFAWGSAPGQGYALQMQCKVGAAVVYQATVVTAGTTTSLPTAASLGVTLPMPKTLCNGSLTAIEPVTTVDELAGRWLQSVSLSTTSDGSLSSVGGLSFTPK